MKNGEHAIELGLIGSPEFCRRLAAMVLFRPDTKIAFSCPISEAWGALLSSRPRLIIFEIGFHHGERQQLAYRKFLSNLRERFGHEIYTVAALLSCDKLLYGGDLLFKNSDDFAPSGLLDSFLALPPAGIPTVPGLNEQVSNLLSLFAHELSRRASGAIPLPPMGIDGWVQSLADPQSRDLWMRWLPRYASYTNENPIIVGETGTGKTNLAFALHLLSGRKGDFISITPRDFSSSELVQAELFGAVAGAYTGAVDKWGLVKSAEKGTLFIDELQSIDKDLQGKLITFIENKSYRRVGSAERVEADVRFVFAANLTLYEMIKSEILRHDFAYRLERVRLDLLPLRSRRLDITAGLAHALAKIRRQRPNARKICGLNGPAYQLLFGHSWPGNLRQLENCVAQLCEIADMEDRDLIDEVSVGKVFESKISGLSSSGFELVAGAALKLSQVALAEKVSSLNQGVERLSEIIRGAALEVCGGDTQAASDLIRDDRSVLDLYASSLRLKKASSQFNKAQINKDGGGAK